MRTAEARSKLAEFNARLDAQGQLTAEKMAVTGISLVVERLQSKGIEGASYSKRKMPLNWFDGKELNQAGTKYLDDRKAAHEGANWGDFREAQGLQKAFVDVTYSGRMLGSWVVLKVTPDGRGRFVARTGSSDQEGDAKMYFQVERYGDDTFDTTPAEQAEVDEIAQDDCLAVLRSVFG
jgi:hypothetical protein